MKVYTIGHGNRTITELIDLLQENGIACLVDVRSAPYSRYNPQFNKEALEFSLKAARIEYIFKGKQLGGRPADPTCYKSGVLPPEGSDYLHEVDYQEVMQRPWFQQGIRHLAELAAVRPVAVLCSEEDPAACHRHHLIARYMMEEFDADEEVQVLHIRERGVVFNAGQIHKSVNDSQTKQGTLF
jgi:uncharacterized protein (DUF488 family)